MIKPVHLLKERIRPIKPHVGIYKKRSISKSSKNLRKGQKKKFSIKRGRSQSSLKKYKNKEERKKKGGYHGYYFNCLKFGRKDETFNPIFNNQRLIKERNRLFVSIKDKGDENYGLKQEIQYLEKEMIRCRTFLNKVDEDTLGGKDNTDEKLLQTFGQCENLYREDDTRLTEEITELKMRSDYIAYIEYKIEMEERKEEFNRIKTMYDKMIGVIDFDKLEDDNIVFQENQDLYGRLINKAEEDIEEMEQIRKYLGSDIDEYMNLKKKLKYYNISNYNLYDEQEELNKIVITNVTPFLSKDIDFCNRVVKKKCQILCEEEPTELAEYLKVLEN